MKRKVLFNGKVVDMYINDACSDSFIIIEDDEYRIVKRDEVRITFNNYEHCEVGG